jgi:hypothetical protein
MLSGLVNPLLGVFLINVNDVIGFHKEKFDEDFRRLENKLAEVNDPNYQQRKNEEAMEERVLNQKDVVLEVKNNKKSKFFITFFFS